MIWKGTHILIKGPTADNEHQSKNQALGSKELHVELRNRVESRTHIWGSPTLQQDNDPEHTARVAYTQLCVNVFEWPSHSLGLNPVTYFWRNLKMCVCPIQPDRA